MKFLFLAICLTLGNAGFAQYYYNDLLSNQYSNTQFQLIKSNNIKQVNVKSFDAAGNTAEGFSLTQTFSSGYSNAQTISNTAANVVSVLNTEYKAGKIIATSEISKGVETTVRYTYLQDGKLESIVSVTTDTALHYQTTEKHVWQYTGNGKPVQLIRIKNNTDTTLVNFITDEQGNIAEEHWRRKGVEVETYFYYYNNKNLLTDIVRFNKRVQKLLPDFLFDYDTENRMVTLTQIPAASSNYIVWSYSYNPKGLKQSELCTNRQKEVIAKMEYSYQ